MMNLVMKDGAIYLDGKRITGVKRYRITSAGEGKNAELVIELDVSTNQVEPEQ